MTAGSVTAGKSRAMTDGRQIPTATSQKWKRACAPNHNVAAAHSDAIFRPGRSEEESGPHEQEDQSDVANEVLVERPGGGYAGHREVPVFGRHEHEEPVCLGCDAHHNSYAETEHSKHRLLASVGASGGLTL